MELWSSDQVKPPLFLFMKLVSVPTFSSKSSPTARTRASSTYPGIPLPGPLLFRADQCCREYKVASIAGCLGLFRLKPVYNLIGSCQTSGVSVYLLAVVWQIGHRTWGSVCDCIWKGSLHVEEEDGYYFTPPPGFLILSTRVCTTSVVILPGLPP